MAFKVEDPAGWVPLKFTGYAYTEASRYASPWVAQLGCRAVFDPGSDWRLRIPAQSRGPDFPMKEVEEAMKKEFPIVGQWVAIKEFEPVTYDRIPGTLQAMSIAKAHTFVTNRIIVVYLSPHVRMGFDVSYEEPLDLLAFKYLAHKELEAVVKRGQFVDWLADMQSERLRVVPIRGIDYIVADED